MDLLDTSTHTPRQSIYRIAKHCQRAYRYAASYNDAHAAMLLAGWTFDDSQVQLGYGSDASLTFLAGLSTSGEGYGVFQPISLVQWFPEVAYPLTTPPWWLIEDAARGWVLPLTGSPHERWENMTGNAILLSVPSVMWQIGVTCRYSMRFHQHMIAKTIEQCLCLDTRGRPREE